VTKPYRGFESLSLRQTVWVAEKLGGLALKIARNGRNSATPCSQTGPEKVNCSMLISGLWPFSTSGTKQYGLNDSIRRMRSDHKPMIKRNGLDFVTTGSIAIETVKGFEPGDRIELPSQCST
jgi:hypothetical protein